MVAPPGVAARATGLECVTERGKGHSWLAPSAQGTETLVPAGADEWRIASKTSHRSQAGRPRIGRWTLGLFELIEPQRHARDRVIDKLLVPPVGRCMHGCRDLAMIVENVAAGHDRRGHDAGCVNKGNSGGGRRSIHRGTVLALDVTLTRHAAIVLHGVREPRRRARPTQRIRSPCRLAQALQQLAACNALLRSKGRS